MTDPEETARIFLEERFPEASTAFLGGSLIRGDATPTSDLDLLIITERSDLPFRAAYLQQGWPVEAFVHDLTSCRRYFASDIARRRPSLPFMCAEGIILRDRLGQAGDIQREARQLLQNGPAPLTPAELEDRRYSLTDLLDDFLGCDRLDEGLFIAPALAASAANLFLALAGAWEGQGKWVARALTRHDPAQAAQLTHALQSYVQEGKKESLQDFAQAVLDRAGGRMFGGYYRRGPP